MESGRVAFGEWSGLGLSRWRLAVAIRRASRARRRIALAASVRDAIRIACAGNREGALDGTDLAHLGRRCLPLGLPSRQSRRQPGRISRRSTKIAPPQIRQRLRRPGSPCGAAPAAIFLTILRSGEPSSASLRSFSEVFLRHASSWSPTPLQRTSTNERFGTSDVHIRDVRRLPLMSPALRSALEPAGIMLGMGVIVILRGSN